jgi:NADPH-dependent 2,4-dienoyl-CoA reductase/sulfur reductase-like enzyme
MAPVTENVQKVIESVKENKTTVAAVGLGGLAVAGAALYYRRRQLTPPAVGKFPVGTLPADAYDAVIVGAGPSGSVCAFYSAKAGAKVAVLDKATFPRGALMLALVPASAPAMRARRCIGRQQL